MVWLAASTIGVAGSRTPNLARTRQRLDVSTGPVAAPSQIIEERFARHVFDNSRRSYFVTRFAFVLLIQGCVRLLLELGVCRKSLI
jgi:hypothetical protein